MADCSLHRGRASPVAGLLSPLVTGRTVSLVSPVPIYRGFIPGIELALFDFRSHPLLFTFSEIGQKFCQTIRSATL